eukprot:m.92938 g.92938  ORF g.92938 m.92938 type:complete len:62 (+) comp12090_c1_seq1:632-817(+)
MRGSTVENKRVQSVGNAWITPDSLPLTRWGYMNPVRKQGHPCCFRIPKEELRIHCIGRVQR